MKLEQKTITTIVADEGKVLKRKSDGMLFGERITLGYNYYDAGVQLSEPILMQPSDFEEVDKPEDETITYVDDAKRMARMLEIVEEEKKKFSSRKLTASDMLKVKSLAPEFGKDIKVGNILHKKDKFQYEGKLYATLKDHKVLELYKPSEETKSLYTEVTEDYEDDE